MSCLQHEFHWLRQHVLSADVRSVELKQRSYQRWKKTKPPQQVTGKSSLRLQWPPLISGPDWTGHSQSGGTIGITRLLLLSTTAMWRPTPMLWPSGCTATTRSQTMTRVIRCVRRICFSTTSMLPFFTPQRSSTRRGSRSSIGPRVETVQKARTSSGFSRALGRQLQPTHPGVTSASQSRPRSRGHWIKSVAADDTPCVPSQTVRKSPRLSLLGPGSCPWRANRQLRSTRPCQSSRGAAGPLSVEKPAWTREWIWANWTRRREGGPWRWSAKPLLSKALSMHLHSKSPLHLHNKSPLHLHSKSP